MFDARPSTALIVSSNPNSVWRIVANGAVEHSTDRGSTWELQRTGVAVMLSGGASPSPSICWLVGPQGTVLLTTDARSWRRVAFPEAVDLLSVRAADGQDGIGHHVRRPYVHHHRRRPDVEMTNPPRT
jgi:photosystem II stability/assembly factor-like uncharacterized protein